MQAIEEAEIIILGPGSLYTSVIPNLIIPGMSEAVVKSQAFKIYICNVMTQPGETDHYSASHHIKALVEHSHKNIINACLINNGEVSAETLSRYKHEHSFPVEPDVENIRDLGYKVMAADLVSDKDYVRHDSQKLNRVLIHIIETHRVIKR